MEPFIGEITMFAGTFAPRGWSYCNGSLQPISQNNALFSLLGTTFGGDGRTTFGLPDLRARIPIHYGNGPGLSDRRLGSKGGAQEVVLNVSEMPSHSHIVSGRAKATTNPISSPSPAGAMMTATTPINAYVDASAPNAQMQTGSVVFASGNTGGNLSHYNLPPFTAVNFIISLFGIYPSRT